MPTARSQAPAALLFTIAMGSSWGNSSSYGEFEIAGAHAQKPRLLGEGSFGKTFEAFRSDRYPGGEVKEWVALKVLNPALLQTEEKRFQFLQEVSALAKFKHQNLVHLIRGGQEGDEVYYAMELCMGGDLRKLVARFGSVPEKAVALIGAQVTAGLREVHDRHGLLHRDIKPENIVLVEEIGRSVTRQQLADCFEKNEGLCRIVDFGLVNLEIDTLDVRKPFAGSPMYASPEQIRRDSIDQTTDIYSLGMSLLYLLKGKGPLLAPDGTDFKSVGTLIDHKISDDDHVADIPPWVSAEFRAILLKMLSKDPATRLDAAGAQAALREYLNSRLKLVRRPGTLEDSYVLGEPLAEGGRAPGWLARRKEGDGAEVRLTVAARLRTAGAPADPEARGREICDIAQRATDAGRPGTFLRVLRIVQTDDALAFEEEHVPAVSLEETIRARGLRKNHLSMAEAVLVLRPVAEAFDALRSKIFIACEDILLAADATPLDRPLTEWHGLEVRISCMGEAVALGETQTAGTVVEENAASPLDSTVVDTGAEATAHLQPVPALCRLLYRLLTGTEVDAAAAYSPMAYTAAARLRGTTNNHLRDLLCGSEPASSAVETLRRFCAFESVPWESGPRSRPSAPDANSSTDALPPEQLSSSTSEATMVAPAREHRSRSPRPEPKLKETSGGVGRGTAGTGKGTHSSPAGLPTGTLLGEAPICEVVRPGVVRSPFDEEQREQAVPPEQWKSGQIVPCAYTQRNFRLPRKLDLLLGTVLEPKFVESPYDPGHRQEVAWPLWIPNGVLVCQDSGARFRLPAELPFLEGRLLADPGVIQSPYDSREVIAVPAESWLPGAWLVCPATEVPFFLPTPLPPLRALADPHQPGVLRSPYAPEARIEIPPARWEAGLELECPVSHRMLTTPREVEEWEVTAEVVNAARRSVRDPLDPKALLEVPALAWVSGGTFPHPRSGRPIRLPQGLPELVAEIDPARPGFVRSPFTGEWSQVSEGDWLPGGKLSCAAGGQAFRLPEKLPEIPRKGKLGAEPGLVISPYDSSVTMRIQAARWRPGELIECEATRKKFRLPSVLPPLVGAVDAERIGWVYSPHSEQWQQVPFESWMPRNTLKCERTDQPFKLPETLPEWLPDVHWVPRRPGRVRSPHNPAAEMDVAPAQWQSGAVLICPSTHRRCRLPILENFPTLEQEKGAVSFAARMPEKSAIVAAETLSRPGLPISAAMVEAIWHRHALSSVEERRAFRAEIFPEPEEGTNTYLQPKRKTPEAKKRTPWLAYAAAVLVVAGLAGAGWYFWPKEESGNGKSGKNLATPFPIATAGGSFAFKEPPLPSQPARLIFTYDRREYSLPLSVIPEPGML
ncbi:MAG TPA: serine/threonine-protein kinase, partial [Chthoniobacteraceae bacterium]|nr:serine/threonine-protein kinase [Chthoniobacteraceae bacterium]